MERPHTLISFQSDSGLFLFVALFAVLRPPVSVERRTGEERGVPIGDLSLAPAMR